MFRLRGVVPDYRGQRRRGRNLVDALPEISASSLVRKRAPDVESRCCSCVPTGTCRQCTTSFRPPKARQPLTARFVRVHRAEPDAACVVVYLSSFLEVQPLVQVVASDDWCIDRYTPQLRTCETVSRCVAINSTQSTRERVLESSVLGDSSTVFVIARRNDVAITFDLEPPFESANAGDRLASTVDQGKATTADDHDCHPFDFAQGRRRSSSQ